MHAMVLGLMHDDTLYETPEVKEALRRLPKKLQEERQYRISRALYLSMRKEILPKAEWTKFEEVFSCHLTGILAILTLLPNDEYEEFTSLSTSQLHLSPSCFV
jgi:Ubiquinol-cytochrome C reductase complex 14kD subunit